jgi:hypothetical protein
MIAWLEQMWVIVFMLIVTVPLITFGLVLIWQDHKKHKASGTRRLISPET